MVEGLHDRINRERKDADPHASDLVTYRRYVSGEQDGTLSADQKNMLGSASKHACSDNMADTVIAAWSSRLVLQGFDVDNQAAADFLDGFYTRNQIGDLSYDVNYATGRDGNHAIMLRWLPDDRASVPAEPDDETADLPLTLGAGRVTVHAEDWWDGKTGVWVAYDDRGRPAYAVKDFEAVIEQQQGPPAKRMRRTVYFPDHLERYIQEGAGWAPYPLEGEPETGIVPWQKRDGSPLGIPVIHFAFPRFGKRRYGVSELAGGFLGNQNHVNDIQQDITVAARLLAFQILTATGVKFEKTPKLQPGTILETSKPDARFGAIPAGDITQLAQALETKLQTIARNTATPIHIIKGGDWPAGIALVQADKPLISKVERIGSAIGPSWATVAHRATEIANAFGRELIDENALITAVFADPEQLDSLAEAQVTKTKAEAEALIEMLNDEESLVAMGMTPEAAQKRIASRQARADAQMEQMTGLVAAQSQNDQGAAA
jgi:hypothetical protein